MTDAAYVAAPVSTISLHVDRCADSDRAERCTALRCHRRVRSTYLVLNALRMALGLRGPGADVELVHHSDRGSQYTSGDFNQELTDHGVLASVGSVGDAYDNAMAESFVDSLNTELIADRVGRSRSQLELGVVEHVSSFNDDRLHESLPPAEFEALHADRSPPGSARPTGSPPGSARPTGSLRRAPTTGLR
jgi:putative transposase